MIKINLATRKQSGLSGEVKSQSIGKKVNFDQLKDLPLRKVLLPVLVGIAASYYLESFKEEEIKKLDDVFAKVNQETTRLQNEVSKFKDIESIKTSLDEDEVVIRTKLETIQKLIEDRGSSYRVLTALSNTLPKNIWLTEIRMEKTEVELVGMSLDLNHISDFMKGLEENAFFTGVELKGTRQVRDTSGVDASTFELKAKRR
jgi:Tfp pilus assembly protein PilN